MGNSLTIFTPLVHKIALVCATVNTHTTVDTCTITNNNCVVFVQFGGGSRIIGSVDN